VSSGGDVSGRRPLPSSPAKCHAALETGDENRRHSKPGFDYRLRYVNRVGAGVPRRPVWVVLKQVPDCRWLLDREDCPWYPAMRLFRQKECGDEVFDRVARALQDILIHFGSDT
jgi:hypothetical protein